MGTPSVLVSSWRRTFLTVSSLEGQPPINYIVTLMEIQDGRYDAALERLAFGSSGVYEFENYYIPKDLLRAQIYGLMGEEQLERARL